MDHYLPRHIHRTRNLPQHPPSIRLHLQYGVQPHTRPHAQFPLDHLLLTFFPLPPPPLSIPVQDLPSGLREQGLRLCPVYDCGYCAGAARLPSVDVYHRCTRIVAFIYRTNYEFLVRFLGGGRVR